MLLNAETGLYYDHARWYDPHTGRFLSQDPTGFGAGDPNLYRYVGNGPTNFIDPSGWTKGATQHCACRNLLNSNGLRLALSWVAPLSMIDLYAELSKSLSGGDLQGCVQILKNYRADGGSQQDAYLVLQRLLTVVDDQKYDVIVDLSDFVVGFCHPSRWIWDTSLRIDVRRVHLLRATGFDRRPRELGLLPPLRRQELVELGVNRPEPGDLVELVRPDGGRIMSMIASCSEDPDLDAHLRIYLPERILESHVPVGTQVNLLDFSFTKSKPPTAWTRPIPTEPRGDG